MLASTSCTQAEHIQRQVSCPLVNELPPHGLPALAISSVVRLLYDGLLRSAINLTLRIRGRWPVKIQNKDGVILASASYFGFICSCNLLTHFGSPAQKMDLLSRVFFCLLSFAVILTFTFLQFLDFLCHIVPFRPKKKRFTSPKIGLTAALLNASC